MEILFAATAPVSLWPLGILAISVALIILLIGVFRIHAFLALIASAIVVGILSPIGTLPGKPGSSHWIQALEVTMKEFGNAAGNIAVVISLAAIIGICLMESGAADKIVRRLLAWMGEKRAGIALLSSGYFLSIPVFFDTVFYLLIPLAKAMYLRSGRQYVFYVMLIASGAVITHSIVAPTPGPIAMAENLGLDLGITIIAGMVAGILPAIGSYYLAVRMDAKLNIPLRDGVNDSLASLEKIVKTPEAKLPRLKASVLPVVLPVLLIGLASLWSLLDVTVPFLSSTWNARLESVIQFLGNKNLALMIGTWFAIQLLRKQRQLDSNGLSDYIGKALESAGVIILITCAGGAFGMMLRHAGVGEVVAYLAERYRIDYILLAWLTAAIMKTAQGSGTVSIIITSGIMASIIGEASPLEYPKFLIFLAIGFGSMTVSWMNDSGFWVVGRMSGFTNKETLKTWTLMLIAISVMGLIEVKLFAMVF
ncbi:MAG TPA: GntP family permease [Verrucomicrobiales bacterium]|nr:GntP family permease [Verrucomicrobiales bacterium]